jgi:hypothetical protein
MFLISRLVVWLHGTGLSPRLLKRCNSSKVLARPHCRITEPALARRHVRHYSAARADDRALTDGEIIGKANGSREHGVILDDNAAGNATL